MTGWWRDFGAARFGRPASPRPIVRPGLLARLDRAFADSTPSSTPHLTPEPGPGPERERDGESELVEGGVQPVVVVVAGSGAGKSTLLQQWAEPRGAVLVQLENGQVPAVGTGAVTVLDGVERLAVDGPEWRSIVKLVGVVPLVLSGREPIPVAAVDRLGAGHLEFAEDETYQVLAGALADAAGADRLAPDLHLLTGGGRRWWGWRRRGWRGCRWRIGGQPAAVGPGRRAAAGSSGRGAAAGVAP
ncbi:hypothetical protein GCM10027610_123340 [Dactylosporangium cerinum]